ncbi:major facilitator superfamily transporter [Tritrichomonas foetus]|uniref:Major facilitator superfamily transporter n=1 Tax=Tritrichomonas foetus TaxID=1144522 RepID=A0A1J4K992_9EUKA|nr:major facilitator superfamily transporter [Tritrichomonas foetus]|eukprot:OHT08065.1 major facilitator superfamily transporter [Tritrichomonas foetus]
MPHDLSQKAIILLKKFIIFFTTRISMIGKEALLGKQWVPLHQRDRLSFIHILGIAAGNLAPGLLWMVIPTLFEPLASKLSVKSWVQTILLFYGSFAGFSICPILGVYSDNSTFRWGRRRIFFVIGLVFIIIGLLMMTYCVQLGEFLSPHKPLPVQQTFYILSYVVAVAAGNVVNEPVRAICTDVTPLSQQNLMANICSAFSSIGGILVNLIGGFKWYQYTSLGQEQFVLIISIILCVISIVITCIVTPEEALKEKPPKVNPFKEMYAAIKTMSVPFKRTIVSFYLAQVAYFQFSFQFSHFMGKEIFKGDNSLTAPEELQELYIEGISWSMMCGAVRYSAQLIWGFVNTRISELIGFKATTILGYALMAVGLLMFYFIDNKYVYLPIVFAIGIGFGTCMSIPFSIVSLSTPLKDFGANLGIMFMASVIGEQTSNLGLGMALGSTIWVDRPRMLIGLSGVIGVIATIAAFWVQQPIPPSENYLSLPNEGSTDISTLNNYNNYNSNI